MADSRFPEDLPLTPPLPERLFSLTARGSSLRTEVLAGTTTFLTMAYIVLVNPAILGEAGLPVAGVAAATCLAAGIASILMGLVANVPLAMAPGMGLNAYFAFTVVLGMKVPWPVALGCVFVSGVCFLLLTAAGIRQMIVATSSPVASAYLDRVTSLWQTTRRRVHAACARRSSCAPRDGQPPHPSTFNAAMNASCGISTFPNCRIRFFPAFCFSSSLRLRVASPP